MAERKVTKYAICTIPRHDWCTRDNGAQTNRPFSSVQRNKNLLDYYWQTYSETCLLPYFTVTLRRLSSWNHITRNTYMSHTCARFGRMRTVFCRAVRTPSSVHGSLSNFHFITLYVCKLRASCNIYAQSVCVQETAYMGNRSSDRCNCFSSCPDKEQRCTCVCDRQIKNNRNQLCMWSPSSRETEYSRLPIQLVIRFSRY